MHFNNKKIKCTIKKINVWIGTCYVPNIIVSKRIRLTNSFYAIVHTFSSIHGISFAKCARPDRESLGVYKKIDDFEVNGVM